MTRPIGLVETEIQVVLASPAANTWLKEALSADLLARLLARRCDEVLGSR